MKRRKTGNEWEFTNQNWRRVLSEITDYAPNRYGRGKNNYGGDHPLVKKLNIKPYELGLIMSFLEDQGLIEYEKPEYNWVNLTSKGFDVALQVQRQRATFRTNYVMIIFSFTIAITGIVSLVNSGLTWQGQFGLIVLLGGLGYLSWNMKKKGALSG